MKIQLLSYREEFEEYSVVHNSIDNPYTFESFEVNIIDLNDKNIFVNKDRDQKKINKKVEIQQLKKIIESSNRTTTIVMLPQNLEYYYSWGYDVNKNTSRYGKCCLLSTMLSQLDEILQTTIIPESIQFKLCYEISTTKCGEFDLKSDFCFEEKSIKCSYDYNSATRAKDSEKPTTLCFNNIYITTLDILNTPETMIGYLEALKILDFEREKEPEWVRRIVFDDDKEQNEEIIKQREVIANAEERIRKANTKLEENSRYKSILYTNGEQLVEVVFDILESFFSYDLSEFQDDKKEDFLIKLDSVTFIGEIKGITSNVKSEHISQLDVHFQGYQDSLRENGCVENVKALLIINPFRNKPLIEREPINEIQEKLAKRNGSLIITTDNLLKLYDALINGEVDADMVKFEFMNQVGILSMDFSSKRV